MPYFLLNHNSKSKRPLLNFQILLVLAPSLILAQRYHGGSSTSSSPNDEPFLPIYPVYPYSPKLIKRGTERDLLTQLRPELYAPKLDARDSYTASFTGNYQRDPYYPTYNPYPKTAVSANFATSTSLPNTAYTSPSTYPSTTSYATPNAYTPAYSTSNAAYSPYGASYSNPYPSYSPSPYGIYNSYSTPYAGAPNPYAGTPYPAGSYPNYNYQAPYYYPNYYNQPYPALPPPPPPHSGQDYPGSQSEDTSSENEESGKSNGSKKSEGRKNRYKDNDNDNSSEAKDEQFVDGANYLSSGTKDLDGQSSTYKTPSPYNQLEQLSDVHLRSLPISGMPRTTYRVISVGGQPVGPDYPIPTTYAKVQQLEQIMSQTLAKLLAQNAANQAGQFHYQNNQGQTDSTSGINKGPQAVIAKTGLAYVMNPTNLGKVGNNHGQFLRSFGNRQNLGIIKVPETEVHQQSSTILAKAAGKYTDGQYGQKPVTTVSLQQAPGIYIPPEAKSEEEEKPQSAEYSDYDSQSSGQNFDGSMTGNGGYKKNEQNYSLDQGQGPVGYHNSNLVTVQTPQAQNFQYSSYLPTQSSQQQNRDYKTNLEDVNFSTKRNSKV